MREKIIHHLTGIGVFIVLLAALAGDGPLAQAPPGPGASPSSANKKEAVREPATMQFVEVTRFDFTKLEKLTASRLSVFGVALGDSAADAKRKFENAGFRIEATRLGGQFDVYGSDDELLGLDTENGRVSRIALFHGMKGYLVGESALLWEVGITDPDSPLRLRLLGREDNRSEERNSAGRTVICSYDKEGIRFIKTFSSFGDSPGALHFVLPAKQRTVSSRSAPPPSGQAVMGNHEQ